MVFASPSILLIACQSVDQNVDQELKVNWSPFGQRLVISPKTKPLRFRSGGLFRAYKRGAEGQSRTDTGLARPVLSAMPRIA